MFKKIILILFLVVTLNNLYAQSISIKGKISDIETGNGIESATVYLSRIQDSTLIDYTISDKNGFFDLKVRKTDKPSRLKITSLVYQTYNKDFDKITDNIDLGELKLDIQSVLIDSIQINLDTPPIRIKNDTLEFNASSFKVREDANVETLLKQLPGVEIDSQGAITVNGKSVSQVLVNGKPFFDADGKIAVQNLPAEIINKVQVTDKKTRQQVISGEASTSDDLSINLTIDEEKNKGYFGRIMAGYGSDERYESSGLVNYFEGDLKVSVLASSNNINASGFSMDEVFDNMNSSRNASFSSNGGMSVNGVSFGGGSTGITQSNLIGFNFSDKWFNNTEAEASYFYSDSSSENKNKRRSVNLLPDNMFTTNSETSSTNDDSNHNVNLGFEIKIDSTSTLRISPNLSKSNQKSSSVSWENSFDVNEVLLNESESQNFSESENINFGNSIYYFKQLKRKGRSFSANFSNSNNSSDSKDRSKSETYFTQSQDSDDIRNQLGVFRGVSDRYELSVNYKEPITDSLSLTLGAEYTYSKSSDINNTFDFNEATQDFSIFNDLLSNSIFSDTKTITPTFGLQLNKSKYNLRFEAGTDIHKYDNTSDYLGVRTELNKNYMVPSLSGNFRYKFNKSQSMSVRYSYNESLPSASRLLPVENLSNPLNTVIGNPDLDLNKTHNAGITLNAFDYASMSGYFLHSFMNFYDSRIVSISTFDENRKRTTTYTNVDDTYNLSLGGNWYKNYKTESGHRYGFTLGMWSSYNLNKGFTNGQMYQAKQYSIRPRLELKYEFGELLTVYPNYSLSYNQTDYSNYQINKTTNVVHNVGMQITSYFPKNFTFGNDLENTYNSNIADGFRKNFFLWNTSLSYSFWDNQMTAKVKVYDLLNQNTSNSRNISDIAITDTEDLILTRYVMFSLSYKLDKFGGKKQNESGSGQRRPGGRNRVIRM